MSRNDLEVRRALGALQESIQGEAVGRQFSTHSIDEVLIRFAFALTLDADTVH
jgi:hypothetical protein